MNCIKKISLKVLKVNTLIKLPFSQKFRLLKLQQEIKRKNCMKYEFQVKIIGINVILHL